MSLNDSFISIGAKAYLATLVLESKVIRGGEDYLLICKENYGRSRVMDIVNLIIGMFMKGEVFPFY